MKIEGSILLREIEKKDGRFVIYKAYQSNVFISEYDEIVESEKLNKNFWKWSSEKSVKILVDTFFEFYSKVL